MATLASKLATWTLGQSYEKLPAETVHEVKRRVIDSIGCALGAYHKPPGQIARAKAMSINDTHAGTVLGTKHSTSYHDIHGITPFGKYQRGIPFVIRKSLQETTRE